MKLLLLLWLLIGSGCAASRPIDPHVWRPGSGSAPESIPGPLENFGPFDSFSDALKATCSLILSKPNATVVHLQERDPALALRVSTEYCAWLYYTPAHKYELSMLTDVEDPGRALLKQSSCLLPPKVDDPRYPPSSIKYIFLLHNHPFAGELSDRDIHLAAAMANAHELIVQTKDRKVPLAVIAFFSNSSDLKNPTCDGFFQYIPLAGQLRKWTRIQDTWLCQQTGTVRWLNADDFRVDMKTASCQNDTEGAP